MTPFKISHISINAYQLAITTSFYPVPLFSCLLIQTHIAAIQIHPHHANPHFFTEHISGVTIADGTVKLIRQAQAYGDYYSNLTTEQQRERGVSENYRMLGWEFIQGWIWLSLENVLGTALL